MNSKQRRKRYRKLARELGLYYMVFRMDGEAIAIAQHVIGERMSFCDAEGCSLLVTWEGGANGGQIKRYTCNRISEAEATTLAEFGIPLYRNSRGIIRVSGC